jgi:hypothetical protein
MDIQYFVVLAAARSGSSFFSSHFTENCPVTCYAELLSKNGNKNPHFETLPEALGYMNGRPRKVPASALGFKFFRKHGHHHLQEFKDHGFTKFIVLRRKNNLAQYVSREKAFMTGRWVALERPSGKIEYYGKKLAGRYVADHVDKLRVNPKRFLEYCTNKEEDYAAYSELLSGQKYLFFWYEDLVKNPYDVFSQVMEMLGVDYNVYRLTTAHIKQETKPIEEVVENMDEVTAYMKSVGRDAYGIPVETA